ncbi:MULTISPECIES: SCO family protein [unclassified Meiothermus]|uniref:SCO family protein n=1 Tax=unclassified Meiothermus TaxID=370471 RepID=UPI0013146DFE|nr:MULTISPECIES: SCO family protein [unclassified Meiothermus]
MHRIGWVLLAGGLWAAGGGLAHGTHYLPASGPGGKVFQPAKPLPPVELQDTWTKAVSFPPKGTAWAIYLGYTGCPDLCPMTLERLRQAYASLGSPKTLRLGFVSLDPANDTPLVMGRYLRGFPPVEGFTGKPEAIARLAEGLEVRYNPGPGGTRLYHTDAIALLDEKGRLVRMIFGASRLSATRLAEELEHLGSLP